MSNEDLVGDIAEPAQEIIPPGSGLSFRDELFCFKYVELKRNGTKAAIAAGYSPTTAQSLSSLMLKRPEIRARIIELAAPTLRKAKLDMEEMLGQIHAIATFDRRNLYHPDGRRKLFIELDAQTAAAISHMGATDFVPYDKAKAIDMAMKHLGGFEKDNKQKVGESLSIKVSFV